jgi:hypothetical protein
LDDILSSLVAKQFNNQHIIHPKLQRHLPVHQILTWLQQASASNSFAQKMSVQAYQYLVLGLATQYPQYVPQLLRVSLNGFNQLAEAPIPVSSQDKEARLVQQQGMARVIFNLFKFDEAAPSVSKTFLFTLQQVCQTLLDNRNRFRLDFLKEAGYDIQWTFFDRDAPPPLPPLKSTPPATLPVISNTYGQYLTPQSDTPWEKPSFDEQKNFDHLVQMATLSQSPAVWDKLINLLYDHAVQLGREPYQDEAPLIQWLRHPALVEAGLTSDNRQTFERMQELLSRYHIFEAVPAMVRVASKGPTWVTAYLYGAIVAMGYNVLPELNTIILDKQGADLEQVLALEIKEAILKPRTMMTLFQPLQGPLPKAFYPDWDSAKPLAQWTDTPTSGQAWLLKLAPSWTQKLANVAMLSAPQATPEGSSGSANKPAAWRLELPGLTDGESSNVNTSTINRLAQAITRLPSAPGENRDRGLSTIRFFAAQFNRLTQSASSSEVFITPQKAEISRLSSEQLLVASRPDDMETWLTVLEAVQDIAAAPGLIRFLETKPNTPESLRLRVVRLLEQSGHPDAISPLIRLLDNRASSLPIQQAAMSGLIRLGHRDTLVRLINPDTMGQVPESLLIEAVEGLGTMMADTPLVKSRLLGLLQQSLPGSELKLSCIRSLGRLADTSETPIVDALVEAGSATESAPVYSTILEALAFLDLTDPARSWLTLRQRDQNPKVATAAKDRLLAG